MTKPTPEEIANYLKSEKNYDDFTAAGFADKFWNYYESKGWVVGKSPMKSWKAAIRTWELNNKTYGNSQSVNGNKQTAGAYNLLEKARTEFNAGRKQGS